jgi:hypothetical protein
MLPAQGALDDLALGDNADSGPHKGRLVRLYANSGMTGSHYAGPAFPVHSIQQAIQ